MSSLLLCCSVLRISVPNFGSGELWTFWLLRISRISKMLLGGEVWSTFESEPVCLYASIERREIYTSEMHVHVLFPNVKKKLSPPPPDGGEEKQGWWPLWCRAGLSPPPPVSAPRDTMADFWPIFLHMWNCLTPSHTTGLSWSTQTRSGSLGSVTSPSNQESLPGDARDWNQNLLPHESCRAGWQQVSSGYSPNRHSASQPRINSRRRGPADLGWSCLFSLPTFPPLAPRMYLIGVILIDDADIVRVREPQESEILWFLQVTV